MNLLDDWGLILRSVNDGGAWEAVKTFSLREILQAIAEDEKLIEAIGKAVADEAFPTSATSLGDYGFSNAANAAIPFYPLNLTADETASVDTGDSEL